MKNIISVIIPCYNEQETVNRFYKEIKRVTDDILDYSFEFIYVNDGSKDQTASLVKELHVKDERVCLVDFSRNFGKEAAMLAVFMLMMVQKIKRHRW